MLLGPQDASLNTERRSGKGVNSHELAHQLRQTKAAKSTEPKVYARQSLAQVQKLRADDFPKRIYREPVCLRAL